MVVARKLPKNKTNSQNHISKVIKFDVELILGLTKKDS